MPRLPDLARMVRPRWAVAYVTGHGYASVYARPYARRYFTYGGARRIARRWNKHNHGPGVFEVFGPAGKGED